MATLLVPAQPTQATRWSNVAAIATSKAACRCSLRTPLAAPSGSRRALTAANERFRKAVLKSASRSAARAVTRSSVVKASSSATEQEESVFFDGGPHLGDLLVNLVFGLTAVWLPLTLASLFRSLNLRYRFTNKRITIISSLSDDERRDFPYSAVRDVKYVPRFIGEWGDIAITLSDKTIVELKSVPKFREIAKYCLDKIEDPVEVDPLTASPKVKGFGQ